MGHTVCTVGSPATPHDRGLPPPVWAQGDGKKAQRSVHTLRGRICRAATEQRGPQVRNLTTLRLRSAATPFAAVRRTTQVNRGRHTPGVDGARLTTPDERAKLVDALRQ